MRMMQQELGRAFEQLQSQVEASRRGRALCGRVIARMQHQKLAVAFETMLGQTVRAKERTLKLKRVLARWQASGLSRAIGAWGRWVQEQRMVMQEQAMEEMRKEL